jgi:anaerobic ribonucleoside-triphosphate reductase
MVMERVVSVIKPAAPGSGANATDIALLVSTNSRQEIDTWDRTRISDSLVKEAGIATNVAAEIASAVEDRIDRTHLMTVTTAIIREIVDLELLERGMTLAHKRHSHLGLPMWDVEQIITNANTENSNTTHNPESVNLTIAETILKEFALRRVFSEDVSEAHYVGDIHLHDLGFIIRPYCGGHSLEYIKKFGLNLPNITSVSKPAKHAEVLIGHMVKMASALQAHYAGAVGWEAVNIFLAPYLEGKTDEEVEQLAQMLIFEFNQLAGAAVARSSSPTSTSTTTFHGTSPTRPRSAREARTPARPTGVRARGAALPHRDVPRLHARGCGRQDVRVSQAAAPHQRGLLRAPPVTRSSSSWHVPSPADRGSPTSSSTGEMR